MKLSLLAFTALAATATGFVRPARVPLRRTHSLQMGRESEGSAVECPMPDTVIRRLEKQSLPHITLGDDEAIYEFWMSTTVPGGVTKDSMMKIEKDAAKNANFPGFKKGQIPPWAKPQLKAFCVEDAINNAILDAIESAELTALDGDDKKAEVIEDVKELTNTFKIGTPLSFTATLFAKQKVSGEDDAVEAEVEVEAPAEDAVETPVAQKMGEQKEEATELKTSAAAAVFEKVKTLESRNKQLLEFIKEQGFEPPAKVAN